MWGKSTLFNRLTYSRDALVANYSGLTRDRKYGEGEFLGRRFMVIDTGGIDSGEEEGIDAGMAEQSLLAMDKEGQILFCLWWISRCQINDGRITGALSGK